MKTAGKCFWIGAALAACMASFAAGWCGGQTVGLVPPSRETPFGPAAERIMLPSNHYVWLEWPGDRDCGVFLGREDSDLSLLKSVGVYTAGKRSAGLSFEPATGCLKSIEIKVPRQRTLEWKLRPDGSVASGPVLDLDDLKAGDIQLYDRRGKPTGRERSPKVHCVD